MRYRYQHLLPFIAAIGMAMIVGGHIGYIVGAVSSELGVDACKERARVMLVIVDFIGDVLFQFINA